MEKENLYQAYQDRLHEAIRMDERACMQRRNGEGAKAAASFREAAALYADAARLMVELIDDCAAEELADYQKSVDRLIAVSRQMKDLAEEAERQASGKPRESQGRTPEGREKVPQREEGGEEPGFTPVTDGKEVRFEDIVGLEEAKQIVLDEIIHLITYAEIYREFKKSNGGGLLLFGPPGSGKTMLARAIANEAKLPFFSVKCSDIVGKYFGEAEKKTKALFDAVRAAGNAVVFLDEAEALACRRGGNSTVMNRLVPELLAQIDGFDKFEGHVIVMFATNRPYDIDPAFLRYGRLATLCYVPLPDYPVRLALIRKEMEGRPCQSDLDYGKIARETRNMSCADLVNLVNKSSLRPINRTIRHVEAGDKEWKDRITQQDMEDALGCMQVSVDQEEIRKMEQWMVKMHLKVPKHETGMEGGSAYAV